jgi:hypothetical protein
MIYTYTGCPRRKAQGWGEWRKEIKIIAIKDQGVNDYFNPSIKVCSYGGEKYSEYCHELYGGTSCKKTYGTQDTGAGISAMVVLSKIENLHVSYSKCFLR